MSLEQDLKAYGLDVAKYAAVKMVDGPLLAEALALAGDEIKKAIPGTVDDAIVDLVLGATSGPLKTALDGLIAKYLA